MGKTETNSKLKPVARTTKYTSSVNSLILEAQGRLLIERKEKVTLDDAINYLIEEGFKNTFQKSVA